MRKNRKFDEFWFATTATVRYLHPRKNCFPYISAKEGKAIMRMKRKLSCAALLVAATLAGNTKAASIVSWGFDFYNEVTDTPTGNDFTAITASGYTAYALRRERLDRCLGQRSSWPGFRRSDWDGIHGDRSEQPCRVCPQDGRLDRRLGRRHLRPGFGCADRNGFRSDRRRRVLGYALKADGSIVGWGRNQFGELTNIPIETDFTQVSGGNFDGLALRTDGSIAVWGNDTYKVVSEAPTDKNYKAVAGDDFYGYALKTDGSIKVWGDHPSTLSNDTYHMISGAPTGTGFTALAPGYITAYALAADGSIVAWGDDGDGAISDMPKGTGITGIAASTYTGYALIVPEPTFLAPWLLAAVGLMGGRCRCR